MPTIGVLTSGRIEIEGNPLKTQADLLAEAERLESASSIPLMSIINKSDAALSLDPIETQKPYAYLKECAVRAVSQSSQTVFAMGKAPLQLAGNCCALLCQIISYCAKIVPNTKNKGLANLLTP